MIIFLEKQLKADLVFWRSVAHMGTQTLMVCANSDMWMWCILGKVDLTPDFCSGNLVVHLTFDILFDKFFCSQIARRPKWIPSSSRAWCATSVWLNKVLWCEQWTRDHTARRYRCSRVLGAEQRDLRGRQGQYCSRPWLPTNSTDGHSYLHPSV